MRIRPWPSVHSNISNQISGLRLRHSLPHLPGMRNIHSRLGRAPERNAGLTGKEPELVSILLRVEKFCSISKTSSNASQGFPFTRPRLFPTLCGVSAHKRNLLREQLPECDEGGEGSFPVNFVDTYPREEGDSPWHGSGQG